VNRNPAHVTYVRNPKMDFASVQTVADHAYWLSGIGLRDGSGSAPLGTVDARSEGFGTGDPKPGATQRGSGTLSGGHLGSLGYTSQSKAWGATPKTAQADVLNLDAKNIGRVTVHPGRAKLDCAATLNVKTDGRVTVTLAGCGRSVTFDKSGTSRCGTASALGGASVRPRGHTLRVKPPARRTRVTIFRDSSGHRAVRRRVARRTTRKAFTFGAKRAGIYTVQFGGGQDVRRFVVVRRGGKFHRRRGFARRPLGCGLIRSYSLGRPVFGGTTRRKLTVSYRLGAKRTARIAVLRGRKVVRRSKAHSRRAGKTYKQRIAPRGLRRGTYKLRLTLSKRGTKTRRFTLAAQRL
jgi:hypothetical protein